MLYLQAPPGSPELPQEAIGSNREARINIEALCAAPPEALAHSPSQMPLSCPVAPPSQREMHKNGSGGGGGVAMRARAARAPKPKSCATSCGTPFATPPQLRRVLGVLVLHVLPKESVGGGGK